MKFAGRDAPKETSPDPAADRPVRDRPRGLLEASPSDGTWRHTGVTFFKTVMISALGLLFWSLAPSFEGWSFGDRLPGGKLGGAAWSLFLGCAVVGALNLVATIRSAIDAMRS